MNTGHDGSFSTCHSNGAIDTLLRLDSLTLQAAPAWPLTAIRQQVQRSIDVIIHVRRQRDGRRSISSIDEVVTASARDARAAPTTRPLAWTDGDELEQVGALSRQRALT
jgi:pilus assembly protein CpaF